MTLENVLQLCACAGLGLLSTAFGYRLGINHSNQSSAAILRYAQKLREQILSMLGQAENKPVSRPAIARQHAPRAMSWLWEQVDALQAKVDELKGDLVISDSRAQAALAHAEASNEAFVAIQHEQQRLIDALQDAITLLEGKPAKWAELAPDYGIDPIAYRPETLKKAAIDEFRALILEVTTPTIDAPAPVAEATAEASAS